MPGSRLLFHFFKIVKLNILGLWSPNCLDQVGMESPLHDYLNYDSVSVCCDVSCTLCKRTWLAFTAIDTVQSLWVTIQASDATLSHTPGLRHHPESSCCTLTWFNRSLVSMTSDFEFQYLCTSLRLVSHVVVVYIIQVKVPLNVHMMTSQGRMCVQCVTNGLQRNKVWTITEKDTLERSCIHVLSVRNVLQLRVT